MNDVAWLSIIGINENGVDSLCQLARQRLAEASLVVGGKRHLALAQELIKGEAMPWPSPPHAAIGTMLARKPDKVCVLCSGDPFYYGMGAVIARQIPMEEMEVFPAPSIFTLVAGKLGWALQDTVKIGLNGRPIERLVPHLQPGARIIALSADETTPGKVATLLTQYGFSDSDLTLMEHVGALEENIHSCKAGVFNFSNIARLNCLAIEILPTRRGNCLPVVSGLDDGWFEHDGQITKREVRAVTLSALSMRKGELLWDIGLGSGSVAIEWLLRDASNRAIGFEKHAQRANRAAANAKKLGVPQLVVLEGNAPAVFEGLEAPDAIFIGGGATAPGMLETAWEALKPGGRLVMNAVSLETEALLLEWYKRVGGELIRIAVERADSLGSMTGWRPAMTVTQWSVSK